MAKNLVIVESPAKSKTITKYLGKDFTVLASYGHVRDLIPREGAIDTEHGYGMDYEPISKNQKHVDAIAKALKKSDVLYLATDPDREGEAISWHLYELLKKKNLLKDKTVYRVVFHEITKNAIKKAIQEPRELSQELINAQQARRGMDYLVGFNLSPLLWKKIRRGLSAGRVQSPALRLIAEREDDIDAFVPREYWTIEADLNKNKQDFVAKLREFNHEPVKQFTINNEKDASNAKSELDKQGGKQLTVSEVAKKSRRRNPAAPFTTSTLQQESVRKLGFSTQRAMRTAQQLYEGIDTGSGTVGLITYMRTDSVTLANEAIDEIRGFIINKYGKNEVPAKPNIYKTKAKNAQEAHEAVRPTSIMRTPDSLKSVLSKDQYKLYNLIWKRTLACQMIHATMHTVAIDFACGEGNTFRATGSTIANPGFMAVYLEGKDDAAVNDDEKMLPAMEKGDSIDLKVIRADQHFTEPPPRFTEATLVRALEEYGIGRPSTYAAIISTLQNREYVEIDRRRFFPTDVGRVVNRFLTNHFPDYVDYDFTARMEDDLDAVSRGEKDWIPVMDHFWKPFIKLVKDKEKSVSRADATTEPLDEKCPKCNESLMIRLGRRGRFIGCSAYPDCDYTRNIGEDKEEDKPEIVEDRSCPSCGSSLLIRNGKYGKFIGCSTYPDCTYIEPLEKPASTGVHCPKCKQGEMVTRRSRRGKTFYSCSRYPDCDYAVWNEPVDQACPSCEWPMLTMKTTKRKGKELVCPEKECGYTEPVEATEDEAVT
jgi:DNA topoisomerase-1